MRGTRARHAARLSDLLPKKTMHTWDQCRIEKSCFLLQGALRLMLLFLLQFMYMLQCFLLLALVFVLLAALVSHCAPP
jgi:hypothetical protein